MKVKTLNGNKNIIGQNIKKFRREKKMSQPEICRQLDLLGVTMYNCDIYEIEYGKKTVKDFEVLAFCKVLGITLEELYSNTDKYYEA
jgi:DNA-binding XRE family transcriptional regulator